MELCAPELKDEALHMASRAVYCIHSLVGGFLHHRWFFRVRAGRLDA